ncbi:MAG: helix-turn-helix transcriptional regulator [Bacteroidales bacterium]|nr:helix-turn-helix transcriptional regulator [Bacteroidales bacterium]
MANLGIIRDICARKKMTIRELAQRIGRDESTIQSAIRRGSTNSMTLESIAKVLGISAGQFFDDYTPEESARLQLEVEHLNQLLREKERLIEVLMRAGNN